MGDCDWGEWEDAGVCSDCFNDRRIYSFNEGKFIPCPTCGPLRKQLRKEKSYA